jgi:Transglycosylase SLT domain
MKRLALCLILAIIFAQPAGAKDLVCSWQNVAGRYRDFTCHIAGEHGVPNVGVRVEDLTPTPEIVGLVARTVRGSDIDPGLVLAVIAAESAFDHQAVSPKNAVGLMQLMPETVARFGVRNPFDAEENVRAGTSYLQLLLTKYRNLKLALAAYNAGEGPVLSYGTVPPYQETTEYVARVLRLYERYKRIPFDRREPVKVVATAVAAKAKDIGRCGLICRGNMLAVRLDDIGRRMPVLPSHPDASSSGSAPVPSARAN